MMNPLKFLPVKLSLAGICSIVVVGAIGAASAFAANAVYTVQAISVPSNLPPGGEGAILLQVSNVGDATATGEASPIVIADKLPPDVVATTATLELGANQEKTACELGSTVRCEYNRALAAYGRTIQVGITVKVAEHPSGEAVNEVSVSGGGATGVVAQRALTLSSIPVKFGVEELSVMPTNEDGSVDTQAGSHPFQLTTTLQLTNGLELRHERPNVGLPQPAGLVKDLHFNLPSGLVGNAQAIPQCTSQEFEAVVGGIDSNLCPANTAIGVATITAGRMALEIPPVSLPLFNLVPARGEPARFGFEFLHVPVIFDTAVRTGKDYGVVVNLTNISNTLPFMAVKSRFGVSRRILDMICCEAGTVSLIRSTLMARKHSAHVLRLCDRRRFRF